MLNVRHADDRGVANFGWLKSRHTFSFGHYYDPQFMGFGPLRVINEDRVTPGKGFDTHGHQDMEIISYVLDGALRHEDSMGNGSIIQPGDVQRMSAGTGVRHSEYNASDMDPVHFLQIWILPERNGLEPSYEQIHFSREEKLGRLRLVGSRTGRDGSIQIHQDVDLYATILKADQSVSHTIAPERKAWIQVARGRAEINGQTVDSGDGIAVSEQTVIDITGLSEEAELLLFDMTE